MTELQSAAPADGEKVPSVLEIFLAFSGIAIIGFGGVLPFARHMMVEKRGWLSATEFNEILAFSQFLPGGNIINMGIVIGQRYRRAPGSIAAVTGLMLWPTIIVIALGGLYVRYGDNPQLHHALAGMGAAAAGLIVATAAKMATPLFQRGAGLALGFAASAFVGVVVLQFSLVLVLLAVAPFSIAAAWWKIR